MINSGDSISNPTPGTTGDERVEAFSTLLTTLESAIGEGYSRRPQATKGNADFEIHARLGIATSLFIALRSKHAATAAHCLRVALGVSSWIETMDLSTDERDDIEIAALLHDIGKIGIPDVILEKPSKLTNDEAEVMDHYREIGREILAGCSNSSELTSTVQNARVWFHNTSEMPGSKGSTTVDGPLSLGARLIAIVDAYDSMTTDRVYRPAMSVERATAELFSCAGTQFDPDLVHDFCDALDHGRIHFDSARAINWLQEISPESNDRMWGWNPAASESDEPAVTGLTSHAQLVLNMHDGVVLVDAQLRVLLWNRAVERMTGISATSVQGKRWSSSLLGLCDENGRALTDEECLVTEGLSTGGQISRRLIVQGNGKAQIAVDAHVAPVLASDSTISGVTLVVHDVSTQITLEEQVQILYEKATHDPLTKVANRAEFDRLLPLFVEAYAKEGVTCSMILCDIDHFKSINDTFGHQAGDEALTLFAKSLQRHARTGDLVARYGGEEFVLLCGHCDNATATRRANEARMAVSSLPLPSLGTRRLTASFGVTEVQAGDTPETFLRRTDRALLQAKDNGRNLVVQLGTGVSDDEPFKPKFNLFAWLAGPPDASLLERKLMTVMPLKITAEKLRGFVADHGAEVISIQDNCVMLLVDAQNTPLLRRWNDRAVPLVMELTLRERIIPSKGGQDGTCQRTAINVVVKLKRQRDHRRYDATERARQLVVSMKSYLMAHDLSDDDQQPNAEPASPRQGIATQAKNVLSHWLKN
jgi:diguanylate cyclase (GGDEF)-like protein/PAS domain S-box-containing protein